MKRALTALLVCLCLMFIALIVLMSSCATQQEEKPSFRAINDIPIPVATRIVGAVESVTVEEQEAKEEAYEEEYYEEYYGDEYYEEYYEPSYSGDGFMQEGVRDYEGRTETWYSSNTAYHYRTSEWSVDDEGYYRDSEGYYVVAASDVPEGTVIDGTKGECKVYDSGCDDGVTDYYVAW